MAAQRDDFDFVIVGGGRLYDSFRDKVQELYPDYFGNRIRFDQFTDEVEKSDPANYFLIEGL